MATPPEVEMEPPQAEPTPAGFSRCGWLDGDAILIDRPLCASVYEDLTVLECGLYHANGNLLKSSGVYRGNGHTPGILKSFGGSEAHPRSRLDQRQLQPAADYIWLGLFQTHFGHFLVGTLSRLWAWRRYGHQDARLVYFGDRDPEALFAIPHVAFCLGSLGIEPQNLHRAGEGDHFARIRVPDPAFIENHAVAPEFGDVVAQIRDRTGPAAEPVRGMVYLSKHKARSGVRAFVGEIEFADCLRSYGATVICPEDLDLRQQIALWSGIDGIATGFAGSAFHTAAFATGRRLCAISPHDWVSSNQVLLDRIAGNGTVTAQTHGLLTIEPAVPEFQELLRITDPKRMADLFMQFVEAEHSSTTFNPAPSCAAT